MILKSICLLTVLFLLQVASPAQDLLSFVKKDPDISAKASGSIDPLSKRISESIDLHDQLSMAKLDEIRTLDRKNSDAIVEITAAKNRVSGKLQVLDGLQRERDSDLAEYRRGEFCSGCGETRSQILAKRQQFPHPGQTIVLPTPSQIKNREAEWEKKVSRAQTDVNDAQQQVLAAEQVRRSISASATRAVLEWKELLLTEDDARAAKYQHTIEQLKSEYATTADAIADINRQIAKNASIASQNKAVRTYTAELQLDKSREEQHLINIASRAGTTFLEGRKADEAAELKLAKNLSDVGTILGSMDGAAFIVPYQLPDFSVTTPIGGIGFKSNGINVSVGLGKLKTRLSTSCNWLRDTCKLGVSMTGSIPVIGSIGLGMQRTFGTSGQTDSLTGVVGTRVIPLGDLIKPSKPAIPGAQIPLNIIINPQKPKVP